MNLSHLFSVHEGTMHSSLNVDANILENQNFMSLGKCHISY